MLTNIFGAPPQVQWKYFTATPTGVRDDAADWETEYHQHFKSRRVCCGVPCVNVLSYSVVIIPDAPVSSADCTFFFFFVLLSAGLPLLARVCVCAGMRDQGACVGVSSPAGVLSNGWSVWVGAPSVGMRRASP